ncbi:hypothetical protein DFH28DRAFT_1123913 [Melampsora americana]|nr:hypothetical protein DFH28DRAFT_1123913 [Melampsora americana]
MAPSNRRKAAPKKPNQITSPLTTQKFTKERAPTQKLWQCSVDHQQISQQESQQVTKTKASSSRQTIYHPSLDGSEEQAEEQEREEEEQEREGPIAEQEKAGMDDDDEQEDGGAGIQNDALPIGSQSYSQVSPHHHHTSGSTFNPTHSRGTSLKYSNLQCHHYGSGCDPNTLALSHWSTSTPTSIRSTSTPINSTEPPINSTQPCVNSTPVLIIFNEHPITSAQPPLIFHQHPTSTPYPFSSNETPITLTQPAASGQVDNSSKRKNPFTSGGPEIMPFNSEEKTNINCSARQPSCLASAITVMENKQNTTQLKAHQAASEDQSQSRLQAPALANSQFPNQGPAKELFSIKKKEEIPDMKIQMKAAELLRDEDVASFFTNLDDEERWIWLKQTLAKKSI